MHEVHLVNPAGPDGEGVLDGDFDSHLRSSFVNADVGIAFLDPQGSHLAVNVRYGELTGQSAAYWRTRPFTAILDPAEREGAWGDFRDLLDGRTAGLLRESTLLAADGASRRVILRGSRLRDGQGRAFVHFIIDELGATRRRELSERLQEADERYRALLDRIEDGFCIVEVIFDEAGRACDHRYLEVNESFTRQSGVVDAVGRTARELTPELEASWFELYGEVARSGRPIRVERYSEARGRWFDVQVMRVGPAERHRVALLFHDITARMRTEAALRDSERRAVEEARRAERERAVLDAILDAAPAGIIVAEAGGRVVRINAANELLWGQPPATASVDEYGEWKGWWAEPSERRGQRVEGRDWAMARALAGQTVRGDLVEIEPFGQPGTRRTMLNSAAPVRAADGSIAGAVVVQMDISALVAAEAARRDSEARFRALADNIAQLAWMTDETGYIFWYNRRWFDYTGTTMDEMRGWGWQRVHHPDHVARVTAKFQRHLASGEPWEDTFPLRSSAGEWRWFLSRAVPVRDDRGRVVMWFGTNTDITAQRDAEESLKEADRRKDEFIAVLAHELRNPLAPVRNSIHVLRRVGPPDPRLVRARDVIDRQVTHMARLIDDLLDVSRIARGKLALQKERCDLCAIVRQTADDYRASLEASGLTVAILAPTGPIWVDGDPVRLAQMIGNLLQNAGRFTRPGGLVEVTAETDATRRLVRVGVRDTGVGIHPSLLPRLFEPFSQAEQGLAREQGGLGLGLALTRGLAELHGGTVTAASDGPGKGAAFVVTVPLSARPPEASDGADATEAEPRGLRILVIEDNRDTAATLAEVLELSGHAVTLAYDGASGIQSARAVHPDVVISDIGLPGEIDGYGVARVLRSERALDGVVLLALSGYSDGTARTRSREAGFDRHFAKPPDLIALERTLTELSRR